MNLNLYKALVISVDDKDKQGKIKIQVLPEMEGVDDDLLPWAIPFVGLYSSNRLTNNLPEKGSTIRVLIDDKWKRFYYLDNAYFYKLFDYSKVSSKLKSKNLSDTYRDISFNLYEDGGLEFHNRKDGSHGFIHKSGSYAVFDKNGDIMVETKNTITLKNNLYSLGSLLEELINDLSQLKTVGSPTTQTSPELTAQMQILLPKVKKLLK